jgi:hypothetical protein
LIRRIVGYMLFSYPYIRQAPVHDALAEDLGSGGPTTLIGAVTVTRPSVVCRASCQRPCSQARTLHTSTFIGPPRTHPTGKGLRRMRKRASAPWNSSCPANRSPSKSTPGIAVPASRCAIPSAVRRDWLLPSRCQPRLRLPPESSNFRITSIEQVNALRVRPGYGGPD